MTDFCIHIDFYKNEMFQTFPFLKLQSSLIILTLGHTNDFIRWYDFHSDRQGKVWFLVVGIKAPPHGITMAKYPMANRVANQSDLQTKKYFDDLAKRPNTL